MKTKNRLTFLLTIAAILAGLGSRAQYTDVVNNQINFEFTVEYNQYFNASPETGNSEPVITTNLRVQNDWWQNVCHSWSCEPNCYDGGGDNIWWAGSNYPFDSYWQAYYLCWEDDEGSTCTYQSGDDDHWEGFATLRDGVSWQRLIYQSSDFRPCQLINSLGNLGSGWLLPNSPRFNQILGLKWRYAAGDSPQEPLSFGTIGPNQTKSDVNSNRSLGTVGGFAPVGYTHVASSQHASPDVWYSFTINQDMPVIIRTNHGETDFDTYLRLWTQSGTFVAADDQSGGNNTSLINTVLCAGTYRLCVEGWQTNTGNFKVSIETGNAASALNANVTSYGITCAGAGDGYVEWNPSGGVAPYSWTWQGVNIPGNYFSGLAAGSFSLAVTDACGSTDYETVTIAVNDNSDPIASCVPSITLLVSQGNNAILSAADIDNGSSDNCGQVNLSLSQSTFTTAHEGSNSVTLTVTDASGNTGSCTTAVIVQNTTGIEEAELLKALSVFPNPNNGSFVVSLSDIQLESDATISVFDRLGQTVYSTPVLSPTTDVDLSGTAAGIYLLRIDNNGVAATKQLSIIR